MASKVHGFGRRPVEPEVSVVEPEVVAEVHKPVFVDKAILNEAVETTLEGADPRHADTMRRLWAMDQDSDAAHAYFSDQVRRRVQSKFAEVTRKEHVVNEVLTQAEAAKVSEYAREYNLSFHNRVGNEHGFFSARRGIDHEILISKFPPNMTYLDFGGSVQYHALRGHTNAVTVAPFDMDTKDPTRAALTKLALRKLSVDPNMTVVTREMARSVLASEGKYHRSETVLSTRARALFSIAVHVYDVPLSDWPIMMEACGVKVHEGCLHFSNSFFEADSGTFDFSGAYYEIDHRKDEFRMRVGKGSHSWYTHKWSDYMKYGANQILSTPNGRYSYQIVERRQDTIFYRILAVESTTTVNRDQYYALPSVPIAEVEGFEVLANGKSHTRTSKLMVRRQYLFPQALWERMLTYASAELDRGGLSYNKMYNYYRTAVPKQTINSILVSGGQSVPMLDVPALVVMAGSVAYSNALLLQRTIRARTDEVERERMLRDESTIFKGFKLFLDSLVALGSIAFSPFASLSSRLGKGYMALVRDKLVTWQPRVRIRMFNAALFIDHKELGYNVKMPDQLNYASLVDEDLIGRMVDLSSADPNVARELLSVCGDALNSSTRSKFESTAETVVGSKLDSVSDQDTIDDKPGVYNVKRDDVLIRRTVHPVGSVADLVNRRKLAVSEALEECNQETRVLNYTCARICRDIIVSGNPNEHIMRTRAEELYNPDLWKVTNGVLVESVLGSKADQFSYSGVFVPNLAGNGLYPVKEKPYDGRESTTGKVVHREHFVLPFDYTGYVLVIDNLKIFNGPAVAESLSRVLQMDDCLFNVKIVCHQGPPGCGKTTTVARQGDLSCDVFLTPTRMARKGLVDRLCKEHSADRKKVELVCRTLDSLLVNYSTLPDKAKQGFSRLKIDEYVLARSGKWIAAAILLGVSEIHAYGDSNQIKHVPRVDVARFFLEMEPQILEEEFVSYRNPPEILAAYNFVYNNEVRTKSKVHGTVVRVKTMAEVRWMDDCRLFSMYQADKKFMHDVGNRQSVNITSVSTVHEGQGTDCDQVVLFNGETRKRGPEDAFYLYGRLDYCLVALSRAKKSFVYVKLSDEPDMITKMIDNSQDVRRVRAATEISTQGVDNLTFH